MIGGNACMLGDDDLGDHEIFAMALQVNENSRCVTSTLGLEAIEKLKDPDTTVPDFIFLDLNKPKMNGKEYLQEIKIFEHLAHIPVVIYSTSSLTHDMRESHLPGACEFITNRSGWMNWLVFLITSIGKRR